MALEGSTEPQPQYPSSHSKWPRQYSQGKYPPRCQR